MTVNLAAGTASDGLGGTDVVSYRISPAAVTVNLLTGTASDGFGGTDTLRNMEWVRGSVLGGDTITGNTIGVASGPGSNNSGSLEGSGLKIQSVGGGTVTTLITNNFIHNYNNNGIELLADLQKIHLARQHDTERNHRLAVVAYGEPGRIFIA